MSLKARIKQALGLMPRPEPKVVPVTRQIRNPGFTSRDRIASERAKRDQALIERASEVRIVGEDYLPLPDAAPTVQVALLLPGIEITKEGERYRIQ